MTEEFNKWWNTDGLVEDNPYTRDTPAFWAWEGWQAAYEQTICANCAKEIHNCARCGEVNPAEIHTCTPKTLINVNGVLEQAGYVKQKEWQGLTAKDLTEIPPSCYEGAIWADAILKEKNT